MPNPLLKIIERLPVQRGRAVLVRLRRVAVGFARDYWHDGNWVQPGGIDDLDVPFISKTPAAPAYPPGSVWHAQPGEILEKMWGEGCVMPADVALTGQLIASLAFNKNMSLLDLSAGLGASLRKTAAEFGVSITGLESDAAIAARGMQKSVAEGLDKKAAIAAYDPMNLVSATPFDCVIARETIYRVADREKFVKSVAACCKPKAQVSFTDYIVNAEDRDKPAIAAWRAFETGADPVGLVEMAELWARHGFNLRDHDDQTESYKKEVMHGLARFAAFVASAPKPDPETAREINRHITAWAHRVAAIEAGMKFYRFYGSR